MVAADRKRRDAGGEDGAIEAGNFVQGADQLVRLFDPAIAQVADSGHGERRHAGGRVNAAKQARLFTHRARPVAGAGPVGYAAVERHANDADVGIGQILAGWRTKKSRDANIAGQCLRVGERCVFRRLLDHKCSPAG